MKIQVLHAIRIKSGSNKFMINSIKISHQKSIIKINRSKICQINIVSKIQNIMHILKNYNSIKKKHSVCHKIK